MEQDKQFKIFWLKSQLLKISENINEILNLVNKVKNNEDLSYAEGEKLIKYITEKIKMHPKMSRTNAERLGMQYEDLVDDARIFVWEYLKNYKQEESAFNSYIYNNVDAFISNKFTETYKVQRRIAPNKVHSFFDTFQAEVDDNDGLSYEEILKHEEFTAEEQMVTNEIIKEIEERVKTKGGIAYDIYKMKFEGWEEGEITEELNRRMHEEMQIDSIVDAEEKAKKEEEFNKKKYKWKQIQYIKERDVLPIVKEVIEKWK